MTDDYLDDLFAPDKQTVTPADGEAEKKADDKTVQIQSENQPPAKSNENIAAPVNKDEQAAKDAATVLAEFLAKQQMQNNGEFLKQMVSLVEQITKSNAILAETQKRQLESTRRSFGIRSVSMDEIDPEDVLEDPVLFFCWGSATAIWDDYRNGLAIDTPYKRPIVFYPLSRMRSKVTGKIQTICFAKVYSKKEAEFVRRHSEWQSKYFQSIVNVQQQDGELVTFAIEANAEVNRMNQHEMFSRAASILRDKGQHLTTADPDEIRRIVLDHVVMEKMNTHRQYRERTLSTEFEKPNM